MADGSGKEIEVKIRIHSPEAILGKLTVNGFVVTKQRVFEANIVYEAVPSLRKRGCLLRLREAGGKAILTFKGPAERSKHKSREELETELGDAAVGAAILERLGFRPTFRYEKYRTEFGRPAEHGVLTLDETPLGWFMELEGTPDWIDKTAARLEFSESDYLVDSYGALYLQHCKATATEPSHMVFG